VSSIVTSRAAELTMRRLSSVDRLRSASLGRARFLEPWRTVPRTVRHQQQHRGAGNRVGEELDELLRGYVDPVEVLGEDDDGPLLAAHERDLAEKIPDLIRSGVSAASRSVRSSMPSSRRRNGA